MSGVVDIKSFGGLRLDLNPWDMGLQAAIRADDVEFGPGGSVGVRPQIAYAQGTYASSIASNAIASMFGMEIVRQGPSTNLVFISVGTTAPASFLYAHSGVANPNVTAGSATHASPAFTWTDAGDVQAAGLGTPAAVKAIVTDRTGVAKPLLYTVGTGFSLPGGTSALGTYGFRFCKAWGEQNRVAVACAPSGAIATANPSVVVFSDPGDPDSFLSTSYVQLGPNDGDVITGMEAWRDLLFVLKGKSAFVFYGVSSVSTGAAEFLWRQVQLPSRPLASRAICTTPFGVVVACEDGFYISTGGDFTRWGPGEALRALFARMPGSSEPNDGQIAGTTYTNFGSGTELVYQQGRLMVRRAAGEVYVWQEALDAWARWTDESSRMTSLSVCSDGGVYGVSATGGVGSTTKVVAGTPGYDQGTKGYLITGASDLGVPGLKTIRRAMLEVRSTGTAPSAGLEYWGDLETVTAATDDLDFTAGVPLRRVWDVESYRARRLGLSIALQYAELHGVQLHLQGSAAPDQMVVA